MNTKKIINQIKKHRELSKGDLYVPINNPNNDRKLLVDAIEILKELEWLEIQRKQIPKSLERTDGYCTASEGEGYITNHLIIDKLIDDFHETYFAIKVQLNGDITDDACGVQGKNKVTYTKRLYYKDPFPEIFIERIRNIHIETKITIKGKEFIVVTNPLEDECEIYVKENMDLEKRNWTMTSAERKIKHIRTEVKSSWDFDMGL